MKTEFNKIQMKVNNREAPMEQNQVNHPSHYNQGKIEVIEFIEDQKLGFNRGNAVKYTCRAGKKDPSKEVQDLEKAIWYLLRDRELIRAKMANREPRRPNEMPVKWEEL